VGKSQAIVGFIANLLPVYTYQRYGELDAACCLEDGTLILPVDESDSDFEEGWVRVLWQGDATRVLEIDGASMATVAVVRHARLHFAGRPKQEFQDHLDHMAHHFEFKTGCALYLPYPAPEPDLVKWVQKGLLRLGQEGVIEAIKKGMVGF
jgi:hypothetical protein